MPSLKVDKMMIRGEHDWLASNGISATKWMDNKSVFLLSNYQNPRAVHDIERRVKGSKNKVKVSCPTVVTSFTFEYSLIFWISSVW